MYGEKGGGCKSPASDLGLISWDVQRGKTPLHMLFIQAMMGGGEQETVAVLTCYYC